VKITLGLEEELQIVQPVTGELVPYDHEAGRTRFPDEHGTSSCEIHKCVLEVQTHICESPDEIVTALVQLRKLAAKRAAAQGHRVLSSGLHPFSSWQCQELNLTTPYYDDLLAEYGDITRSTMSFGLHVHVGLPNDEHRIPVMNALRQRLPHLMALSASSPFMDGRDTRLQSWRHSLLDRYPRTGIPEAWADERTYDDHLAFLRRTGCITEDQGLWEDLRLHHKFGTLEVRICDATHSADRNWLIVALIQSEVATLVRECELGTLPVSVPRAYLEENKYRARRHGLAARFLDWERGVVVEPAQEYAQWLLRVQPAATAFGYYARLERAMSDALQEGSGGDQQRAWLAQTGSFAGLVAALVDATARPCAYLPTEGA
jgi:carboxylate-amine ligase